MGNSSSRIRGPLLWIERWSYSDRNVGYKNYKVNIGNEIMEQKIQDKTTDFATHYRTVINATLKSTPYKPMILNQSEAVMSLN